MNGEKRKSKEKKNTKCTQHVVSQSGGKKTKSERAKQKKTLKALPIKE